MDKTFFNQDGINLAKQILGKYLIRNYEGKIIVSKIVETESYMGVNDKGAHVYGDKKTERTKPLYLDGGHIYVYLIYGMYYCLNISANIKGIPECVLIRAVEPMKGIEEISFNRFKKEYKDLSSYQKKNITNGPGKLCMALNIDKSLNSKSILGNELYISDFYYEGDKKIYSEDNVEIESSKRINIDYAEEAKDYLWRFFIKNSKYVSVNKSN
ncbi:DNA-3-methyladenine glycosylase [Romboutsia sp.]|uniref:DNA-3-methyladenine glycosylase n=1 Tax=Romboutsia sp. TaxID=1965302 RepID=UPI002F403C0C